MKGMSRIAGTLLLAVLAALALPATVAAQGVAAVRKQVEMSWVVVGQVRIAADGRVEGLQLDRESELPAPVVQLVRESVPRWRFDPLPADVPAQTAQTPMTLRVVLRPAPESAEPAAAQPQPASFVLRIVSARFGDTPADAMPRMLSAPPPRFPKDALGARMPATVYLVVRVGRDGRVVESFAEQVNLFALGSEQQMARFRQQFADTSLAAVKRWRFAPPTRGDEVGADSWQLRVPVDFLFDVRRPKPGTWRVYVPGPRQRAPWARETADSGVDAFADSGPQPIGGGRRLLSALGDG